MTTVTIDSVREETRAWESDDGKVKLEYITLDAVRGENEIIELSYGAQASMLDEYMGSLKALEGQTIDVDVEDTGRKYRDVPQLKLKSWPDKPRAQSGGNGSGGGGGGGRGGDWETAAERRVKNISIETQKAAGILATIATQDRFEHAEQALGFICNNVEILARAIHDARDRIAGEGAPSVALPSDGASAEQQPSSASPSAALQDLRNRAKELLKTEGRVVLRYKQLFDTTKPFGDITDSEFVEIIESAESE